MFHVLSQLRIINVLHSRSVHDHVDLCSLVDINTYVMPHCLMLCNSTCLIIFKNNLSLDLLIIRLFPISIPSHYLYCCFFSTLLKLGSYHFDNVLYSVFGQIELFLHIQSRHNLAKDHDYQVYSTVFSDNVSGVSLSYIDGAKGHDWGVAWARTCTCIHFLHHNGAKDHDLVVSFHGMDANCQIGQAHKWRIVVRIWVNGAHKPGD